MINLGAFQNSCPIHPNHFISDICVAESCSKRILCPECRNVHDNTHFASIKSAIYFLTVDISLEIERAKEIQDELDKNYQSKVSELDSILDRVRKNFETMIQQAKKKILLKLPPVALTRDFDWEEFKNQFEEIKFQCLHGDYENSKTALSLREKYVDKYIAYLAQLKEVRRQKDLISSPNFYIFSEVENLIMDLQKMMSTFEESLSTTKKEVEAKIDDTGGFCLRSIDLLGDQNMIAVGDTNGNLAIWSQDTLFKLHSIKRHADCIFQIVYLPSRNVVLTASADGTIGITKILHKTTPQLKEAATLESSGYIHTILALDKKDQLFSSSSDPDITIWDLSIQSMVGKIDIKGKRGQGADLVYIPKYEYLVCALEGGYIGLYSIEEKRELSVVDAQYKLSFLNSLAYLEKKNILIAGSDKGNRIRLYKLRDKYLEALSEYELPTGIANKIQPVNKERLLLVATGESFCALDLEDNEWEQLSENRLKRCSTFVFNPTYKKLLLADAPNQEFVVINCVWTQ